MEHKGTKFKGEKGDARTRVRAWCAYQERSQNETRQKLRGLGVEPDAAEEIIAGLISENFLNEERFAIAFAGGKFRVKQWGKVKIRTELKSHKVSDPVVRCAMESIPEEDYNRAVRRLAEKKMKTILTADRRKKYESVYQFLVRRGFEGELVASTLNELIGEMNNYEFRT